MTWRAGSGGPRISYEESVEQALCFGWVDSKGRSLDAERTMLWFAPRKRGSGWARTNKERIERLAAAGLMAPAGHAVIDAAKADGSWTLLDDVENLVVPDDLAAAFAAHPPAPGALGRVPALGAPRDPGVDRAGQAGRDAGQARRGGRGEGAEAAEDERAPRLTSHPLCAVHPVDGVGREGVRVACQQPGGGSTLVGGTRVSLIVRGLVQRRRLRIEPALSLVPLARPPPKGCWPTTAPVGLSFT